VPASLPASKYDWSSTERVARIVLAVAGGWLLTDLIVAWMSMAGVVVFGMEKRESVVLMPVLGCLLYLCILIWAFAERSLKRLATVIVAGSALSYALARLLMQFVPAPGAM
jgi:hypothetical protein